MLAGAWVGGYSAEQGQLIHVYTSEESYTLSQEVLILGTYDSNVPLGTAVTAPPSLGETEEEGGDTHEEFPLPQSQEI